MPAMKICDGDPDPIGYEVISCLKGTNLKMPGLEKKEEACGQEHLRDHPKV